MIRALAQYLTRHAWQYKQHQWYNNSIQDWNVQEVRILIYGIGHDVLEIKRVARIVTGSQGSKFIDRILTPAERNIAQTKGAKLHEFVAGRFAAKEAISKGFGSGIGSTISFGDIEIVPNPSGKPTVALSAQAWERLGLSDQAEQYAIHLSISHQTELASAFAVIEKITLTH